MCDSQERKPQFQQRVQSSVNTYPVKPITTPQLHTLRNISRKQHLYLNFNIQSLIIRFSVVLKAQLLDIPLKQQSQTKQLTWILQTIERKKSMVEITDILLLYTCLLQAMNDDFSWVTLENQKSRTKVLEVEIEVLEALQQELDAVQTRARWPGWESIRVGFHIMRVNDEDRVEMRGTSGRELESRVVVDPNTLPEPHQRTRPGSHHRRHNCKGEGLNRILCFAPFL